MKKRKGYYSISVVAKMFSVHQQTIRMYEKEGLISPKRTEGNTRLFSEEDVDRLERVIQLTHKLGVNLAGVQMILKLQKKIKRLQNDMNGLFEQLHGHLDKESNDYKELIKEQGNKLLQIKRETQKKKRPEHKEPIGVSDVLDVSSKKNSDFSEKDTEPSGEGLGYQDWEIDYEDDD